jgi:hypothetical protein
MSAEQPNDTSLQVGGSFVVFAETGGHDPGCTSGGKAKYCQAGSSGTEECHVYGW